VLFITSVKVGWSLTSLFSTNTAISETSLRQGGYGYIITVVCLSVSNLARKLPTRFAWNFREGWHWDEEPIWIMTLVRRALEEVCTVSVLLVSYLLSPLLLLIYTDYSGTVAKMLQGNFEKYNGLQLLLKTTVGDHDKLFWHVMQGKITYAYKYIKVTTFQTHQIPRFPLNFWATSNGKTCSKLT